MKQAIDQSKDQQPIEYEVKATGKPTEKATLPAAQYDAQELAKLVKKIAPGILIVTALHCWKGFMQPLVIQCVTIPVTLLESPLFQVYVLKKAAAGTLARPWKEESPFAALTGETGGTAPVAAPADTGTKPVTTATPDTANTPAVVQNGS
ncbi:phosphate transporter (Pho88) [Trebouxia sp. C0009 RCD-2024]